MLSVLVPKPMNVFLALYVPIPSVKLSLVFVLSLGLCALVTWLVLRFQRGVGFDSPDEPRKQHSGVTSRLGGLGLGVTLTVGACFAVYDLESFKVANWGWLIACNALVFGIGFLDDLRPLGAKVKLLGQLGAACILWASGLSIDVLSHPTEDTHIILGLWSLPITILWLIAIPNIVNLIDGMDGLATGFGLFLCLTLAFVGHMALMPDVVMASTVMAGALAGFLLFNFPPAKIFLGDGGAYLIGFFIASVSLASANKGYVVGSLLVTLVALGVPILDTLFAILRRAFRGVPVFRADAEHIHHRLISLGYTKRQALGLLYGLCVMLSLAGISIMLLRGHAVIIVASALCLLTLATARYLGYVKSWSRLQAQLAEAMARRRDTAMARVYGELLELESDRLVTRADFDGLLEHSLRRIGLVAEPGVAAGGELVAFKLSNGRAWVLYPLDNEVSVDVRRRWAEYYLAGVEGAEERWPSEGEAQAVKGNTQA